MRGFSIVAIALLGLGVAACGQSRVEAAAELAANEDAATPKPAEPGQVFVGEVTPEPLQDYVVPVDPAAEDMASEAPATE